MKLWHGPVSLHFARSDVCLLVNVHTRPCTAVEVHCPKRVELHASLQAVQKGKLGIQMFRLSSS